MHFLLNQIIASDILIYFFLSLYTIGALLITVYSIGFYHLLFLFVFKHKKYKLVAHQYDDDQWPYVTVQIPMYNEKSVAESIIDCCALLDYPTEKLEIQVIDDSTDETLEIVNERAIYWNMKGINVTVVHREKRDGFKAGALQHATQFAKGEFLAIFDADFRPNRDFLKKTVGYFRNPKVAVVQTRWGHLNREFSMLTRAQSLLHDGFFMIEQQAREIGGYLLRFNGSAGIWRKETIRDIGGWSSDTIAEDHDMCLKAQLKGWKFVYDFNVVAQAELPLTMTDFKIQQHRWTKGRGQNIKKYFWKLLKSDLKPMVKFHAIFDLINVFVLVGILLLSLTSIPVALFIQINPVIQKVMVYLTISLINVLILPWITWLIMEQYSSSKTERIKEFFKTLFPFIITIVALPFFLTISLFDGFFNKKSFFYRTSKHNIIDKAIPWKGNLYKLSEIPLITWFEGLLAFLFIGAIVADFSIGFFGFLPYHILLSISYSFLFIQSFKKV